MVGLFSGQRTRIRFGLALVCMSSKNIGLSEGLDLRNVQLESLEAGILSVIFSEAKRVAGEAEGGVVRTYVQTPTVRGKGLVETFGQRLSLCSERVNNFSDRKRSDSRKIRSASSITA